MRIELGYPDAASERDLLKHNGGRAIAGRLQPCINADGLTELQQAVHNIHISDALLDYLQALLNYTRTSARYLAGLSPRAGLALKHGAQAWALMAGRDFAIPEDVQAVLPSVAGHRLQIASGTDHVGDAVTHLLKAVAIP
jgi:MoxR-like ATPase